MIPEAPDRRWFLPQCAADASDGTPSRPSAGRTRISGREVALSSAAAAAAGPAAAEEPGPQSARSFGLFHGHIPPSEK